MNRIYRYLSCLFCAALIISSCEAGEKEDTDPVSGDPAKLEVSTEKLYEDFKNPWGMTWLPDGRLLVTEKAGEILVFKDDKFTGEKLTGLPQVSSAGQGGLLDIQLHPDYKTNGWIYISYSKPVEGGITTAVSRFKLQGNQVTDLQDIFLAKPFIPATFHFGSRIIFDKDKFLFVSVGERGTQPKVQELNNDHGKIHRIYDDGRIPSDNPFANQKDASASIWTYGHRNPQGMVYDAATNRIWAVEHGPKGGDELNLIEKAKNYGWPKTSYGINYDGSILTKDKELPGIENPVRYWVPSIGPCGMTIVTSDKYPAWKGNLLIGALAHRHLARVELSGNKYVTEEKLMTDMARFRYIAQSPDGFLYAITEGPGLLLKLVPRTN
ncbi:PQQ-dependent sugar dehydrogenase [Rhodocytophaga rosea]|uniref:PQQ-dependent sugar dehydrogenase n=1 Tax=Rhodocytophaga rosea TaxID=2704465 RepID=A0A6C0GCD3_9BACT|nr:PQQ-dependent sugar dehydrogenase [Rhodocytophaga rosea]QHT65621.1 PQQ-dependent sugar dehydrogenase [Rhodocytophaga rosea]